ncbi:MAG: hypothetical protein HUK28_07735, partial [Methanobrevibacter sp.]|nr:hypothetical protein [Methanobrevibacter sp.]
LEELLKHAEVFIKGQKVDIVEKNSTERVNEAMKSLIKHVYFKLDYFKGFAPDKPDILEVIKGNTQETFSDSATRNAIEELYNHIKLKSDIHEKISLKDILNKFSSAPYGYVDLDIEWMVAKLFAENTVSLTKNSENISLQQYKPEQILNFLTKAEFRDKILVEIKKETPIRLIKIVKSVYKELFDKTSAPDNDEELMESFKTLLSDVLTKISNCLIEYNILESFPGKSTLEHAQEVFKSIQSINNTSAFYKYVAEEEDELLDLGEDIRPILHFFTSVQKDYFRDATLLYNVYEKNRYLVNSTKLDEIADEIGKILKMPNPYSNIKSLDGLISEYNLEYDKILEEEKAPVRKQIEHIRDSVEGGEREFNNLLEKLEASTDISQIRLIPQEAENIKDGMRPKPKPPVDGPEIETKEISLSKLISKPPIDFKSNDDIDTFIDELKEKLRKELEENKEIKLNLW